MCCIQLCVLVFLFFVYLNFFFVHFVFGLFRNRFVSCTGMDLPRDNGLKLFLEKDDMERLYDFEEECVEGYFREQEIVLNQSTEERIKSTNDRVENMSQKIEDINQKENLQSATVQTIDFRLRKVEESAEQILSTLAVIHRFMSAHTSIQDNLQCSSSNISTELRIRAISETEPPNTNTLQVNPRRKFNRSLTEVRPDAYIFDDGLHFEVRTVQEEEEMAQSPDMTAEVGVKQNKNATVQCRTACTTGMTQITND